MPAPADVPVNLYDTLADRGLLAQATDSPEGMRRRLATPVTAYVGFDPTADSLHVGSLVPIMVLAHVQRCGHKPLVLVGGATALVGDPSGKTESRQMLTPEEIDINARRIAEQIGRLVRFDESDTGAELVNNADWLGERGWIQMLRDIGPHFSINRMLGMESVKGRLDAGGLTFLEFSYMVMQAYDFVHLHRERGCTLQAGGQDQWGNIIMGIELQRRLSAQRVGRGPDASLAHSLSVGVGGGGGAGGAESDAALGALSPNEGALAGLTVPLMTKADGSKFGKTESGNVWLDPARTPPYDFYQFWRNTDDRDVERMLATFTFLPMDDVRWLGTLEGAAINDAKETLAHEVTRLVHGETEADAARDAARRAFGADHDATAEAIPSQSLDRHELEGEGVGLLDLMRRAGLASSNGEARRLIQGGGVRLHDDKVADPQRRVVRDDVREGHVLLRVGKKKLFRFDVTAS